MGTLHDIIIIVCFCHSKHTGLELPQINYRACRGKKYHYVYGIGDFNFVDGEKVSLTLPAEPLYICYNVVDCET